MRTPGPHPKDTTVADDTPTRSNGARSALVTGVLLFVAMAALPGTMLAAAGAVIGVEYRRVRTSRWFLWAAITLGLGVIAAGLSTSTWMAWSTSFAATTWAGGLLDGFDAGVLGWAAAHTTLPRAQVIGTQLAFGVPTGLALGAVYSAVRSRARRLEGAVEGDAYSNMRPVGWLDRRRERSVRHQIAAGDYLQEGAN